MKKLPEEKRNKIIEKLAQEYVNANNDVEKRNNNMDTLFYFGSLGLRTPREIIEIFYNSIEEEIFNELNK